MSDELREMVVELRVELIELISECENDKQVLINQTLRLSDSEVLALYICHTFDSDWRGALIGDIACMCKTNDKEMVL
ncbi:hypothetical protein JMM81_15960 [Bacillus sp. V3B]|uniref:hypothetical protein n=1 Tax=Bacillus sp. V3B TaxID=2804915 RepID=UPI00210E2EF2|nr:hypothetical protein [Bacillus sp. V3B]MCQ6276410.1 hypothetical protein [Bacillus sp. V3B]